MGLAFFPAPAPVDNPANPALAPDTRARPQVTSYNKDSDSVYRGRKTTNTVAGGSKIECGEKACQEWTAVAIGGYDMPGCIVPVEDVNI